MLKLFYVRRLARIVFTYYTKYEEQFIIIPTITRTNYDFNK